MEKTTIPARGYAVQRVCVCLFLLACTLPGMQLVAQKNPSPADPLPVEVLHYPQGAVGLPEKNAVRDAWPGFVAPPVGYGQSPFWVWVGEKLDKEKILWQLDQLKDRHMWGLVITIHHTDKHIFNAYKTDPVQFSPEWWELVRWTVDEAAKRGLVIGFNDYGHHYPGEGWYVDEISAESPEVAGRNLVCKRTDLEAGAPYESTLPEEWLSVQAFRVDGRKLAEGSGINLSGQVRDGKVAWTAPAEGIWRVLEISYKIKTDSYDAMNPIFGKKVIEKLYGRFEENLPGRMGNGFNIFDHDEEGWFWIDGVVWNDAFAGEFRQRHGYDLMPLLPALFEDIGAMTPKVRLDYWDTHSFLMQRSYFEPIGKWTAERGMMHWIDHRGRGQEPVEFGNYMAATRWLTPGMDQSGFERDIVKDKVSSSTSHLYERRRSWLEGNHSIGWGTTPATLLELMHYHYATGMNIYSLHALYYSTLGGWWEWAPPCFHFRMPYWHHADTWLGYTERLSYLMSQGEHRTDVAIIYPVTPGQASMQDRGRSFAATAFEVADDLFNRGVDFDFMDDASLHRAEIAGGRLNVSGESYRVLVLPSLTTVSFATMEKALAFYRAGGRVVALDYLPSASDRIGRADPRLGAIEEEMFGTSYISLGEIIRLPEPQMNASGGMGYFVPSWGRIPTAHSGRYYRMAGVMDLLERDPLDFEWLDKPADHTKPFHVNHRTVGPREIYMVYGVPAGAWCAFRTTGSVELWEGWDGTKRSLFEVRRLEDGRTAVKMPLETMEAQLIVFHTDKEPVATVQSSSLVRIDTLYTPPSGKIRLEGVAATAGPQQAVVCDGKQCVTLSGTAGMPSVVPLEGLWDCTLQPTMDNRWGDFRLPAFQGMIGAEARRFRYAEESAPAVGWEKSAFDDTRWETVTYGYGPRFWKLGPLSLGDTTAQPTLLAGESLLAETVADQHWKPLSYSWRWGIENEPGQQGYHGLKGRTADDFIAFGPAVSYPFTYPYVSTAEAGDICYYLTTFVVRDREGWVDVSTGEMKPAAAWINGQRTDPLAAKVRLKKGENTILLRFDGFGKTHYVLEEPGRSAGWEQSLPLSMSWYGKPGLVEFNVAPQRTNPTGWYRFLSPPGLEKMTGFLRGRSMKVWVNGQEQKLRWLPGEALAPGARKFEITVANPAAKAVEVAIRVEQEPGIYSGAAFPEPIALQTGPGQIIAGDWSKMGVLETYSGGLTYRRTIFLTPEQLAGETILDLGDVAGTVGVSVNGSAAQVRVQAPWLFDLSNLLRPGENTLEVTVYNTLANHYLTIPSKYAGDPRSGMLGPVRLVSNPRVVLTSE